MSQTVMVTPIRRFAQRRTSSIQRVKRVAKYTSSSAGRVTRTTVLVLVLVDVSIKEDPHHYCSTSYGS
eukprot:scaffold34688_cov234-Amphora_coffeaeformis.AAC.9